MIRENVKLTDAQPGDICCGFELEKKQHVASKAATLYTMRHKTCGAELLYFDRDDENKTFCIGFKTLPEDDTGVFHILEHSVLNGSKRFPVKEPFVSLLQGSMQTFLNAMTYPDKTIYPVATTNEQDLYNLMDVYLDAVFNPAIYTKPTIFEQEGWHYELDLPEGAEGEDGDSSASLREGTLRYNGVVFNEMKGALSDPMSVLDDAVNAALYPDTAHALESGGDPRAIPTLTYEQFLDTHARHYNPSNSYITLYGDLDVDRALSFLNERYLSQPSAASRRMDAAVAAGEDPSTLAPNPLGVQAPVTCEYKRVEMATTPENALVGLGLVLGSVRAVFPVRGRAAFLPDMALVGAVLLGLQSYAAALSAGGVLRWYMPGSAFLCAFGAERLLRPALRALEQGLFWLAAGPLRLARRALQPLAAARKKRAEQVRARRTQKRSAKKPKKNLPSTRRLLYNSNVSK